MRLDENDVSELYELSSQLFTSIASDFAIAESKNSDLLIENDELKKELQLYKDKIIQTQSTNEKINAAIGTIAILNKFKENVVDENYQKNIKITSLETEISEFKENILELEKEIKKLNSDIKDLNSTKTFLEKEKKSLETKNSKLEEEKLELQSNHDEQLEKLNSDLENLRDELQKTKKENTEIREELSASKEEITSLNDIIDKKDIELKKAKEDIGVLTFMANKDSSPKDAIIEDIDENTNDCENEDEDDTTEDNQYDTTQYSDPSY